MVRRGGGGRLGRAFKGAYKDRPVGSLLQTMRGNVEGIIHADRDMPAGGLPVCGTRLALELPARMPIMPEEAGRMEMDGASFMVRTFMNTNEHPLHRPLGQEGPDQEKHHHRNNGSSFHSILVSKFPGRAAGINVDAAPAGRRTPFKTIPGPAFDISEHKMMPACVKDLFALRMKILPSVWRFCGSPREVVAMSLFRRKNKALSTRSRSPGGCVYSDLIPWTEVSGCLSTT